MHDQTRFTARDRRRHTRQTTNTSRAHHAHVSHPTPKTKMEEARTLVATAYALRLTLCLSALCALRENTPCVLKHNLLLSQVVIRFQFPCGMSH